jgi:2-amino-4-hydroxy-6-hydroxymethyldihydropteridine diphosphokinase/dihydropteroate synthase
MIVLGLGSNVGDRLQHLRAVYRLLQKNKYFTVEVAAPVYLSQAQLLPNAPVNWNRPYFNTAIRCTTKLTPDDVLSQLQAIEIQMGRDAEHSQWAPRVIDIDILYWSEYPSIKSSKLTLPHAHLFERPFALWPLEDLVSDSVMASLIDYKTHRSARDISQMWGSRFDKRGIPFQTTQLNHRIDTPYIMGILNITPNSFSDGGQYIEPEKALEHAIQTFNAGADIIDVGAESTRPNNIDKLSPAEEWRRLLPVLQALTTHWKGQDFRPRMSIDTRSPVVAEKALHFDISFINDVTGFTNPAMLNVAKDSTINLIFMHALSMPPRHDNVLPLDKDPIKIMKHWATYQLERFIERGIKTRRLIFDPGIGFGKTPSQNIEIIKRVGEFHSLKLPILMGHSRKSFLEKFMTMPPEERDLETANISTYLAEKNIDYLRVHHVASTMRSLKTARTLL